MAPLLLSYVLTKMLEMYIRQSFDIGAGSLAIFFKSTISIVLIALILLFTLAPALVNSLKKKNAIKGDVVDSGS